MKRYFSFNFVRNFHLLGKAVKILIESSFAFFLQDNAQKIAEFLSSHPRVKKVNFAGLPGHLGRSLHYSQVHTLVALLILILQLGKFDLF